MPLGGHHAGVSKGKSSMSNGARNAAGRDAAVSGCGEATDQSGWLDKQSLSIGVVAKMFKTSTLSLRLLELRGLIRRERVGRDRIYSWSDCERIAVLVKARRVGLSSGDLKPMLKAMDEQATKQVSETGRLKCLSVIHALESRQQAIGHVLGELYRIDWEISGRLGVKDSGGTPESLAAARPAGLSDS
jgi:DNA-binding transcriptional MerR regulator